jgi:hypothetical protein
MKNINEKYLQRIIQLIDLASQTLATEYSVAGGYDKPRKAFVNPELYYNFRTSSLSFIKILYGQDHIMYTSFDAKVEMFHPEAVKKGRGILNSIKTEIEQGWLVTTTGLVTAEIFSDFLEMAEHLIEEGYKDPAAVMVGSVLEEHLRQLCNKNQLPIEYDNSQGKLSPKRADSLNADLAKAGVFGKLGQKNVTAWLDLRNHAAHGKYTIYTQQQVELMIQSVRDFISRNSL